MKSLFIPIIVSLMFVGCSKKSADDYLNAANENLKNNKPQEAVAELEAFLKDNPESERAPEAMTNLASIYQNKMLKNLGDKASLEKAVVIYKDIFDKYPNSKEAPTSLFMSAFILANELAKYHRAEVTYQVFLQKFPDHELAASAREELKNLGIAPDDILKRNNPKNI